MHAFILAGGFATRLWPLTEHRAKPLLPVAGVPLINYLVEDIPADVPITVSTNAAFEKDFTDWKQSLNRDVTILIEQTISDDQKLGALGATAQWIGQAKINDDILLLTGDNYCGFTFSTFLEAAKPGITLIAVHDIQQTELAKAFGTVLAEGDRVTGFEEKPAEPKTTLVNTGCSLLPKEVLPILLEYAKHHPDNVGGVFEELLQHNKSIECFRFTEPWFDIGSFQAYLKATQALVGENILQESDTELRDTSCTGSVVIGPRCQVSNSELENVVLFGNCTVHDCVLRDCIIDTDCELKGIDLTGKMLRQGTRLQRK